MDDKKIYDIDTCYAEILEQNELINEHSTRYKPSQIKKNINNLYKLFNHNFILEKNILNKILKYTYILPFKSMYYSNFDSFLREIYNNDKVLNKSISEKTIGEDLIEKIYEINKYLLNNYLDSLSTELIFYIISNKKHNKIINYLLKKETIDGKIFCSLFYKYGSFPKYFYDKKYLSEKFI